MCRLSWNLGASTSWNPLDLSRAVMGLLHLYLYPWHRRQKVEVGDVYEYEWSDYILYNINNNNPIVNELRERMAHWRTYCCCFDFKIWSVFRLSFWHPCSGRHCSLAYGCRLRAWLSNANSGSTQYIKTDRDRAWPQLLLTDSWRRFISSIVYMITFMYDELAWMWKEPDRSVI